MPQDWGRATPRAKVVATAASIALPPALSTLRPTFEAAGDSEATTPPSLRTAFLYCEPSTACASPTVAARSSKISDTAARARDMVLLSYHSLMTNITLVLHAEQYAVG